MLERLEQLEKNIFELEDFKAFVSEIREIIK